MIIVTGGAGFIGSCLVKALNDKGVTDILVVDHMTESDKWKNLIGKKYRDYLDRAEFRDFISTGSIGIEVDAIYHMGACSATTEKNVAYLIDNNFAYSKEVFAFAHNTGADFIYASSAATYGNGDKGYSDRSIDSLRPLNAYGYSKQLFDEWLKINGYGNAALGIKFFNVFGPNEYHKGSMASMVFKAWEQISKSGKIRLFKSDDDKYEDGGQLRDFIYVKDTCEAVLNLHNKKAKGIYNLGTGNARTWNDLANAVFKALGKETNIEYVDMPLELSGQYQNYTQADMMKFGKKLPNFRFHSLEDAVDDYIKNHLQKDWKYL